MEALLHILHNLLFTGTEFAILAFEILAVILLMVEGVKGLIALIKHEESMASMILRGFSEGLTFLLGAEILKTIILQDVTSLIIVAGVTGIRIALSVLIHWEMHLEEKENHAK